MPFASLLQDRFTSTLNQPGLGGLDWSAIGIDISKNAGVNLVLGSGEAGAAGHQTHTKKQAKEKKKQEKHSDKE